MSRGAARSHLDRPDDIPSNDRLWNRLLRWAVPSRSGTLPESFEADCKERFDPSARALCGAIFLCAIAWWPTDLLVLRAQPQAFGPYARWRLIVGALCSAYVLLPRRAELRPYLPALFTVSSVIGCALVAHAQGPLGGPETPWFHLLYIVPFISMPIPLALRPRVVFTVCLSLAALAGYLLPFPGYLASPFVLWMGTFFTGTTAVSLAVGHGLFVLQRENFHHARLLEDRVSARTAELRNLLAALERAREDERTRVARNLHDELGQELLALRLALDLTRRVHERDPESIGQNLAELTMLLNRTRTTTRNLVVELRPRVLDDLGLGAAAEWLVRSTETRSGLRCRLIMDDERVSAVAAAQSTAAFRILQESLTNVVRHAEAKEVEVNLGVVAGELVLSVRDDGVGVPVKGAPGRGGSGLVGMRERALSLGGVVEVAPRIEGGTEVRCRLPLTAPSLEGEPS